MIHERDVHALQCRAQPNRDLDILARRQGDAGRVIVRQHNAARVGTQCLLHQSAHRHIRGIHAAVPQHIAGKHLPRAVQTQQINHFIPCAEKMRQQIVPVIRAAQQARFVCTAGKQVATLKLRHEPKQQNGVRPDALDLLQLLRIRL